MSQRLLRVFIVLMLGLHVSVPKPPREGWSLELNGPFLAVVIYATLTVITLIKVLNHLPGVFALRRPLGIVQSGYEYLWGPAIVTVLAGFKFTGVLDGREDERYRYWTANYGHATDSLWCLAALGTFTLLMWSLKLHATMVEANRRLEQGNA